MIRKLTVFILAVGLCLLTAVAGADLRDHARKVLEENGASIVTVETVLNVKVSFGGQSQESEETNQSTGVFVREDGLLIAPLSSIDPSTMFQRMNQGRAQDMDFSASVKSIKFILADDSEIEATIVLRDTDLDIAFLKPQEALDAPVSFVNLENSATAQVMDEVFTLGRMGRVARRVNVAMTGEVQGVVERPRQFFILSDELLGMGSGLPIFNDEGKVLGFVFMHFAPSARQEDQNFLLVMRPITDVMETMNQIEE